MLHLVRLLALATVLCSSAAFAQNTWDGNGDLNVNINGRNNALTPSVVVKPGTFTALASTQTLTLTGSAQTLTVPTGATSATFTVTGGNANYRDDGTAPTASIGLTLPPGVWSYSGPLAAIQFILPTGVTGTVVTAGYYK